MKYQKYSFLSLFAALILVLGGCGQSAPKGFPKTLPFSITVTKGGAPVADASVILKPSAKVSWTATGKTDASGVAEIRTMQGNFVKKGLPAESYTVTISKLVDVSSMVTVVNDGTPAGAAAYAAEVQKLRDENPSEVPEFFGNAESSPIETTVSKGTAELKIELDNYPE